MATMRTALILRQSFRISFSPNPPRVQIPALTLPHARIGRVRSNATGPGSGGGERKVPSRLSQMQKILQESEERAFSADAGPTTKITLGVLTLFVQQSRHYTSSFHTSRLDKYRGQYALPCSIRSLSSHSSSESPKKAANEDGRKDIATSEDPFDAPTYNIPEKPMTFAEGASYSVVILAGLGVAAVAAYAVFKELIFEPKEYKIFGKALARIQHDSQVRVRIGSPVTGYGQESMNRAARQRIPHRSWTDEDGIEHVEVNFYIRGPHGAGTVDAGVVRSSLKVVEHSPGKDFCISLSTSKALCSYTRVLPSFGVTFFLDWRCIFMSRKCFVLPVRRKTAF